MMAPVPPKSFTDMDQRTKFHDPPLGLFDPLNANPQQLEAVYFPEKPDRTLLPQVHASWTAFFTPPPGVAFRYIKGALLPAPDPIVLSPRWGPVGGKLRKESSGNWSGAYVKPSHGASLRQVAGRWSVPTVSLPGSALPNTSYISSTWIGFDGQRRYRHSSLPQIGTEQIAGPLPKDRASPYSAWVQWWERDHQLGPRQLNIAVQPGDDVHAMLSVLPSTVVPFMVVRFHVRVGAVILGAFDVTAPSSLEVPPVQYQVSGATAQWIMERPSPLETPGLPYDLPAYAQFNFEQCAAVAEDPFGRQFEVGLSPGHTIRMKDAPPDPRRRRTISVAERIRRDAVRLTYKGP